VKRIVLTDDISIDPNGFRVYIGERVMYMHETSALHRELEDLKVQCRFWRQAAEHAVDGWNKLEDEHELLKETLRALAREDDGPEDV
jgi:hypothetical protein